MRTRPAVVWTCLAAFSACQAPSAVREREVALDASTPIHSEVPPVRGPHAPDAVDATADARSLESLEPQTAASPSSPPHVDDEAELAKKLLNPVAALISVPIQYNIDYGIGAADADRTTLNVQPVIPIELDDEWNIISRTIVPIIDAESPVVGGDDESGFGDVLQSLFFSPVAPTSGGWIWGAGPALLLPTASEDALGSEKWALGPTAVVLKQSDGWTYGALANHLWSFAGDDDRAEVNATFVQPFLAYTTSTHTTLTINSESTYDWTRSDWTVPINLTATQILKIGSLPISVGVGYREYVETPDGGPDWGLRFVLTFLFPK
jgi:hypothetical protein